MYNSYSDPISFSDQTFSYKLFLNENNLQNSKQEINSHHPTPPLPRLQPLPPPPLSFFHLPSPFDDDEVFYQQNHDHELFLPHQAPAEAINMEVVSNKIVPSKGQRSTTASEQIPRRRSCKRDRHSKIKTARGLRDRRMRLSLEVAKRFFGLQDMLGFEKASKTVEWLLNQAKDEITQMAREKKHQLVGCDHGVKSASSTSECEGVSGLDEVAVSGNRDNKRENPSKRKSKGKVARKSAFFHPFAKVSREKARERARERTKEKIRNRILSADGSKQCNEATNQKNLSRLSSSWNPFEMAEDSGAQSQNMNNPTLDAMTEVEEQSSQAKEYLARTDDMNKWSPSIFFNSLNNSGLILQEHQLAEFQSLGKPWEAYNNHI